MALGKNTIPPASDEQIEDHLMTLEANEKATKVDVRAQDHYVGKEVQPIEIFQMHMSAEEFKGYLKGNALKYLLRADAKNGVQDYEKANVYTGWLVQHLKGEQIKGLR